MGPGRFPSLVLVGEFCSLGTNTNYGSYWEVNLALQSVVRSKFPARVLQVVTYR